MRSPNWREGRRRPSSVSAGSAQPLDQLADQRRASSARRPRRSPPAPPRRPRRPAASRSSRSNTSGRIGEQPRRLEPRAPAVRRPLSSTIFDSSSLRGLEVLRPARAAPGTRPPRPGSRSPRSRRAASMRCSGSVVIERRQIQQRLGADAEVRILDAAARPRPSRWRRRRAPAAGSPAGGSRARS